jgi:GntR family transcriptional repressor for pyruvate dehydrogenase complex
MLKQPWALTKMVRPPMQQPHTTERRAGRRETVARVARQLESAIEEAGLRNEPRLPPERELALTLGVSRSTLREAIQRLIATGAIDARHSRGLFIRRAPPASDMLEPSMFGETAASRRDTLEFRLVVECAAARLAATRAADSDLRELQTLLQRMTDAVHARDVEAEALADAHFHLALVRASHNRMLATLCLNAGSTLRSHIARNTLLASASEDESHRLATARLAQHRAIYDAISAHRPHRAAEAMQTHIEEVGRQFDDCE